MVRQTECMVMLHQKGMLHDSNGMYLFEQPRPSASFLWRAVMSAATGLHDPEATTLADDQAAALAGRPCGICALQGPAADMARSAKNHRIYANREIDFGSPLVPLTDDTVDRAFEAMKHLHEEGLLHVPWEWDHRRSGLFEGAHLWFFDIGDPAASFIWEAAIGYALGVVGVAAAALSEAMAGVLRERDCVFCGFPMFYSGPPK